MVSLLGKLKLSFYGKFLCSRKQTFIKSIMKKISLRQIRAFLPTVAGLNEWAQGIKSAAIAFFGVVAMLLTGVSIYHVLMNDTVTVVPIRVPASLEDRGFSSDIVTARLLDEVTRLHRSTPITGQRTRLFSKDGSDVLGKLQASVGGVDIRQLQAILQDLLGIQKQKIAGEITFKKIEGETTYTVRLRRLPSNEILLHVQGGDDPDALLKKAAMAMIEALAPYNAASIYWYGGDEFNARRMITKVLLGDRQTDIGPALALRMLININQKKYAEVRSDFERGIVIAPKNLQINALGARMYGELGEFDKALELAEATIALAPKRDNGYYQKAQIFREMKRYDEAFLMFQKAIDMKPPSPIIYLQTSSFMQQIDKVADAELVLHKGLSQHPNNVELHVRLAGLLLSQHKRSDALREVSIALELDPAHRAALRIKAELDEPAPVK
jgi:tetratricopeptide (TPR) repeat protein